MHGYNFLAGSLSYYRYTSAFLGSDNDPNDYFSFSLIEFSSFNKPNQSYHDPHIFPREGSDEGCPHTFGSGLHIS